MSAVVQFVPKADRTAADNCAAFITMCRHDLQTFGASLDFDSSVWEVQEWVSVKAKKHAVRLRFCHWDDKSIRQVVRPLPEPFGSFAKAYLRYRHAWQARSGYSSLLIALRALGKALEEVKGACRPSEIDAHILNRAAQLLVDGRSASTAYTAGLELEAISNLVSELRLVPVPTRWKNYIKPPAINRTRVGREFDELRQKKMPSPAAFNALGSIFQGASTPDDILVSSVCAVLCGAPSRISEAVLLPFDCEVNEIPGSAQTGMYGLRWRPAKGAAPMVKWVVSSMHGVVREAVARLKKLSAEGLALARWYEAHPTQLYLPTHLEHLRGSPALTMREVSSIVFDADDDYTPNRPWQWCNSVGIKPAKWGKNLYVPFDDVQQAVLSLLPAGFPILDPTSGMRYSDGLLVLRRQELDPVKATYRCMLQPIEPHDIGSRIAAGKSMSIFNKHGFTEDDGSPLHLSTHTFRHYLNTLAQANFMDQLDLARWSGRANVSQNAAYDHVSDAEVTRTLRLALAGEVDAVGPIARLHQIALIPRDQFARLRIPTAHTTEFGYCVHDYTMLPCQAHQDCMNCTEHACIKGDGARETAIRTALDETRTLLNNAHQAMSEDEYGSDKWVAHHSMTLQRLESLCNILDDPAVPQGAVIRLNDAPVVEPIEQADILFRLSSGQSGPKPLGSLPKEGSE